MRWRRFSLFGDHDGCRSEETAPERGDDVSDRPTIECRPDGPYLVKDLEHLTDSPGNRLDTRPVMALCRCGGSANKPFCDGTHKKNGFSGARLADGSADRRESYRGERITIHDNRSICAHAGHCTDGLASVFKYGGEPWIDPSGDAVETIVETVRRCPSGALSYTLDGVDGGDQDLEPAITATKDGPYAVTGGPRLLDQFTAQGASLEHYTLCRCGASKNKPFCDGTHWNIGFKA
jgi:CDGSH-type Zn-finger protein